MLSIFSTQSTTAPSLSAMPLAPSGKGLAFHRSILPVKKHPLSRNIREFPYGKRTSRKQIPAIHARLCDVDIVKNNLPYQQSKDLFNYLAEVQAEHVPSLIKQPHAKALKQIILVGTQLLLEVDRLSRHPSYIPNATHIRPASLVVYREQPDMEPEILKELSLPEPKPMSYWPFRPIANITKEMAAETGILSPVFVLNAFMQALAWLDDLTRTRPVKSTCETANLMQNTLQGVRQLKFSKVETHRMQAAAKIYGYENDLTTYLPEIYRLIQNTQTSLKQAKQKYGDSNVKLGIWHYDSELPSTRKIQDVSALFPGCDIKAFLPSIEQMRDQLEELYYIA